MNPYQDVGRLYDAWLDEQVAKATAESEHAEECRQHPDHEEYAEDAVCICDDLAQAAADNAAELAMDIEREGA